MSFNHWFTARKRKLGAQISSYPLQLQARRQIRNYKKCRAFLESYAKCGIEEKMTIRDVELEQALDRS